MTQPRVIDLGDYEVSNDATRIDLDRVEALIRQTYWAAQRPRNQIERALSHSVLFGAYRKRDGLQVGFCRVVTDFVSFGWVADVIVDESTRGRGIGKGLMQAVIEQPELAGLPLALSTADAQGLYEQFGFTHLPRPQQWMLRADQSSRL
ncbi:MAG TPA: GNAT family N-acetyltransferase [Dehalococcoidia bacterium]|nr:GNAT family N-acetyltransferase [Dehalococcoidia bacterium]